MKALIICNKSEIGYKIIKKFDELNYDMILATKDKKITDKLNNELKKEINSIVVDVASTYNCEKLYKKVKDENIDVIINCIDMANPQKFIEEKIDHDLDLIDTNIKGIHTITKLFLQDFESKDKGVIVNICSDVSNLQTFNITYNAIKSYISSLTYSITEELIRKKSNIKIHFLCANDINKSDEFINKLLKKLN